MSLFLAEIAGILERQRLDLIVNGLIPGTRYNLHLYYDPKIESRPVPIKNGAYVKRQGNSIVFDSFVVNYNPSYNSMADALLCIPVLSLDGIGISNIVQADTRS